MSLPDEVAIEDDGQPEILDARRSFLEERHGVIGSTDVAAILGLSRWGTPLSVYRDKVEPVDSDRAMSLSAWLGLRLENLVAELYVGATGKRVRADNRLHRHPNLEWFACHLDRRVIGEPGIIVELKTRGSTRGWGDDGSADIPADVWCQVQAQLIITGAREVHVAVLFSNSSFRVYRILPDAEFEATLLPTLERFWLDHVIARVPPAPSGHDVDTDYINKTAGGDSGQLRAATPEQEEVVARLRLAIVNEAQASLALEELKNAVKVLIGEEHDGLVGSFGTIWWKRTKERRSTKWEQVATVCRAAALDIASRWPGEKPPEVENDESAADVSVNLYTEYKPGIRVFRPDLRDMEGA
jgi:putative phage-type endonuclease